MTDEKTKEAAPSPVEDKFYPSPTKDKSGANAASPPADKIDERSATSDPSGTVQTEAAPEPADQDTEPETEKAKSPRSSWADMRAARYRAEAEAKFLREQLAERNKAASSPAPPAADTEPAKTPADPAKPKSEDFATYDEFLDARDLYNRKQWEHEQVEKQKQTEAARAKQEQDDQSAKQTERFSEREKLVIARSPDYQKHFDAYFATAKSNPVLNAAVLESAIGADLVDHLGRTPEELARIVKLDAKGIYKAIGVLEDRLEAQAKGSKAPTITKAPPPLGDVGGHASAAGKDLTMEERLYGRD